MLTLGSGVITIAAWVAACSPSAPATTYPTLLPIGEAGGDCELDISLSEKDFFGQSAFAIARGFYGGKCQLTAKKVELYPSNLSQLSNIVKTTSGLDVYTGLNTSLPVPLFVKFVHTRSDVAAKTITLYLWKAYTKDFKYPFIREDISTQDWTFECLADVTMANKDLLRVEVTQ